MKVAEIRVKSILTKTNIPGIDYCLNPYVGCGHGCKYCYATFMRKYSGHDDPWGTFVDAKINAPDLLKKALRRDRRGEVIVSSVTDPYQPLEKTYRLTRSCLELLSRSRLRISILTKSSLVTRDVDLFKKAAAVEVGLTVTTDDERVRLIFEPGSSPIKARIEALRTLHDNHIATYAFVGPLLPMHPETLADALAPYVVHILVDRMNYDWKVRHLYEAHRLGYALAPTYFEEMETRLVARLSYLGIPTHLIPKNYPGSELKT
jgi:DNA repair photolyase